MLASAAVLATFALGGAGKFGGVRVNADPKEYSVTFNESNTTVEDLDGNYAFGTTTAAGSKVGVVGWYNEDASFTFKGVSFRSLMLYHYDLLTEDEDVAYPFSTITGFAISFSGEDLVFRYDHEYDHEMIDPVVSGHEYREDEYGENLSITPDGHPEFMAMGDSVTVSSLTIWYSC